MEDGMEPNDVVNLGTAVLALAALIVLFRIFRGELSDNKGGMVFAVVLLGGMAYFIRTDMGRRLMDHLLAILR
jgi:multisubunit Na+/H+ antiporter MnhF subunit